MPKSNKDSTKFDPAFLARHPHADEYVEHDGVTPYLEAWEVEEHVAKVKAAREADAKAAQPTK